MKAVFKVWENLPLRGSTERTREEEEGAVPGRRPPHTHQLLIANHQARRGQGRAGAQARGLCSGFAHLHYLSRNFLKKQLKIKKWQTC